MKKILRAAIVIAAALISISAASCSHSAGFNADDVKEYSQKIERHEALSEDDYRAMTDIMEDAYKSLLPDTREILALGAKAAAGDSDAAAKLEQNSAEIDRKYSGLNPLMDALMAASPEQMGKDTYRRFHNLVDNGRRQVEDYARQYITTQSPDTAASRN